MAGRRLAESRRANVFEDTWGKPFEGAAIDSETDMLLLEVNRTAIVYAIVLPAYTEQARPDSIVGGSSYCKLPVARER